MVQGSRAFELMTLKFLVISVSYNLENVRGEGRGGKVRTQGGQELNGSFT